jgi:hypothetical protein
MEEYKKIPTYNYSVSNMGNVRNDRTNRILQPGVDGNGYFVVNLCKNEKPKTMRVHKLVANAFIEKPDDKTCVDHKNNNKLDNNINNLRWVTYTENNQNASISSRNSSGVKGVSFYKNLQKWRAHIKIDGILIHIGYYNTIEEAAQARIKRARQAFGQYINACEGVQHEAKPIVVKPVVVQQIEKTDVVPVIIPDVQPIEKQIVKLNVQKIFEIINELQVELSHM